jgi:hypothetical protein
VRYGLDEVGAADVNDFDAQLTLPWSKQSRPA